MQMYKVNIQKCHVIQAKAKLDRRFVRSGGPSVHTPLGLSRDLIRANTKPLLGPPCPGRETSQTFTRLWLHSGAWLGRIKPHPKTGTSQ